jgi:hypothetical protein
MRFFLRVVAQASTKKHNSRVPALEISARLSDPTDEPLQYYYWPAVTTSYKPKETVSVHQ